MIFQMPLLYLTDFLFFLKSILNAMCTLLIIPRYLIKIHVTVHFCVTEIKPDKNLT